MDADIWVTLWAALQDIWQVLWSSIIRAKQQTLSWVNHQAEVKHWIYKLFIYNLVTITHWHFWQVSTVLALLIVSSSNPQEHKPSPLKSRAPTDSNAHGSWEMAVSVEQSRQMEFPELCCQAPSTPEEAAQKRSSFSQDCSKTSFSRAGTRALCVMIFAYIFLKPD